ncbi:formate dehydrogenase accessory sulfurtransferase FdhD [Evansella clarkii]|uniref:formate dehydrogenase accessory sulfurtransferase FdhD n=1 Tax=Evansella clarkii TaxID=79879 RepID=UPI000B44FDE0|nr:formate dehydrogenase accessory sulfurtransferase FdhD [Evansella clarkii]
MFNKTCPEEYPINLYVNGRNLLTIQLTEVHLEDWAVGYLFAEGLIESASKIEDITIDPYRGNIHASLDNQVDMEEFLKKKKTITAGCGKGATFRSMKEMSHFKRVKDARSVSTELLRRKMKEMYKLTPLYHQTGGMHAACIIDGNDEMIVREDIGRHNAIDKVIGAALKKGLSGRDCVIMTTGRISMEMCSKVARFGAGVAASRTASTNLAVALAKELNVDLVGYVRGQSAYVYTEGKRVMKLVNG